MEPQTIMSWGFWSLSRSILLLFLVLVAMNLSAKSNASAVDGFRNDTDQLALLEFKQQILDDPHGVLSSWNHSEHHCQWQGITCDTQHQRVTALTLAGKSLSGTLSPHIGNLSFMKSIQLGGNLFHGEIPPEIGRLFRLRFLNLSRNTFSGEIPVNLSHCSQITTISLSRNRLQGKIPAELGNLKKLESLYLSTNYLTGEIPSSIGNLSSLISLYLVFNNLEGFLPKEIGWLTRLSELVATTNQLSGTVPDSIYNISTMTNFLLGGNFFHGSIPTYIGLTFKTLQTLSLGKNNFFGRIPVSITNISGLNALDLSDNKFEGQVPINIGDLSNLQFFNLGGNILGSNSTRDLIFISSLTNNSNLRTFAIDGNNFGGTIPKVLTNLSYQLTGLGMGANQLAGTIPEGFGNFFNLYAFDMSSNYLSGEIPSDFSKFKNLQFLGLNQNRLSGEILYNLCNVTTLFHLDLSSNLFEGHNIVGNILMNCQNLQELDISQNKLSGVIPPLFFEMHASLVYINMGNNTFNGSLPLEVGKLIHLVVFNISYNMFSGEIPPSLADCLDLEHLRMEANFFHGMIPSKLASLTGIQEIDLSSNSLTGQIPRDLGKLQSLKYLNLSYNDLVGEIPTSGIFANASQVTLIGNHKLCGGIPELALPTCPMIKPKNNKKSKVIVVLSTVLPVMVLAIGTIFLYYAVHQRRDRRKKDSSTMHTGGEKLLRVSYFELKHATAEFSADNLVGSGSFGVVYKGRLDQHANRVVAVKVLDVQRNGASKSFKAECRVLRNIRHRNLVSILTYCSSIDSNGHEFKAVVYEFMENGSLDMWLHPESAERMKSRNLNFHQRLSIALEVASALDYLHNHSEVAIVHCDLKPSNILLDKDLVAHVGDFGLARLLPRNTISSSQEGTSSSVVLKGTIGYAAPESIFSEYGLGLEASTQGDVYSYGMLLLEMFTGRRPTDAAFVDDLDLHNCVKMALPEQVWKIVDPSLLPEEVEQNRQIYQVDAGDEDIGLSGDINKVQKCLVSIFQVGLGCSQKSSKDRMDMKQVARELHLIRDAFQRC
nr:probable LRR receptor-like serine/threonine-protein kinase At3g47570 isoform X1 [Coffea arabica]